MATNSFRDNVNAYNWERFRDSNKLTINNKSNKYIERLAKTSISELLLHDDVAIFPYVAGADVSQYADSHLLSLQTCDGDDKSVRVYTSNVMGFISTEKTSVTISSRFESGDNKYFFLLYMLSRVCGVSLSSLQVSRDNQHLNLYPFLFVKALDDALRQGVFRCYVDNQYNDMKVRGRVDVARHIRQNMLFRGNVAYAAREREEDNWVLQLVRHTIHFLQQDPQWGRALLASTGSIKRNVATVVERTPSFSPGMRDAVIRANMTRKVNNPLYDKYAVLQHLCLKILLGGRLSPSDKKSDNKMHGLLFDGAMLWELYIASVLKEHFVHFSQNQAFDLLSRDDDSSFQKIVPDYLSRDYNDAPGGAHASAVADAKYMFLDDAETLSADRAAGVYYKTIMYMYRFNSQTGFLFHPSVSDTSLQRFSVSGTQGKLFKAGLRVQHADAKNYSDYAERMQKEEAKFVEMIEKKEITPPANVSE